LNAYELASASERFSSVHRSSPYYDSGLIYQAQLSPPELEAALAAYEAALLTDDFPSSTEAADSHYRRGWLQRQLGANVEEYIVEFQRAVEIDPNHSLAHAFLGQAYFQRDQDIKAAEAQILLALELSPNSEWIYIILGDVYREAGRVADAAAAYRQALAIVPDFAAARTRLEALEDNSSDR
jgi:tetratricopeptide (TPR) repeat protein